MGIRWASQRLKDIPFAGIRRIFEKARRLENLGKQVVHFEIGRPDFDTPEHIKVAAKDALDRGQVHYTPNAGLPALKKALAEHIHEHKGVYYDPDTEMMATAGGQEAMALTLLAFLEPGDEVLIPDPGYTQFASCVRLAGGVPVAVPLLSDQNLAPDLDAARNLITVRTRAMVVNSPHNPTGAVMRREQIEALCGFARENELVVFSDEAYDRMVYGREAFCSPAAVEGMRSRTVIWGSLSKSYAMTGWRIGYLAGPEDLVGAAVRVQQNLMLSLCSFAQAGAVAALTGPQDCVTDMVRAFEARSQVILDGLERIPGLSCPTAPGGAFYAFVKHHTPGLDSWAFADRLLEEEQVALVPGPVFGERGHGFVRISYATDMEHCREGMDRIARFVERVRRDRCCSDRRSP